MHLRKKLDEKYVQSKFESKSRILDDILSSQRPSSAKSGLGYDKEKEPEYSSFIFQDRNKRNYVVVLKSPIKKDSKKYAPSSHKKYRTDILPKKTNDKPVPTDTFRSLLLL